MRQNEQVRVKDNRSYTKNPTTGTIVNTDEKVYIARKRQIRAQKDRENRLTNLEDSVENIQSLLTQLIGKLDGNNNCNT